MRTIAVLNQKGGSAKTTTTVNVAAALAEKGASVLIVDLDPQASASTWLGVEDGSRGLLDVLLGQAQLVDLMRQSPAANLSVVPASPWLVGAERALAGEVGAETLLREQLEKLSRFDYVFVDCPPALGLLGVQALVGCRELLVPVTADPMALSGLAALLDTHAHVRARLNKRLALAGIVVCRVKRTFQPKYSSSCESDSAARCFARPFMRRCGSWRRRPITRRSPSTRRRVARRPNTAPWHASSENV